MIRFSGSVKAHSKSLYPFIAAVSAALCLYRCTNAPQYAVRGDAPVSSMIGQEVVHASSLPLNQRYDELNDGDKQRVRELVARYDSRLQPDGEPPFPLDGLGPVYRSLQAEYHQLVRRYKNPWQGGFTTVATVEADGQVVGVIQYGLSPPDIGSAVGKVVRHTKFKPALCHGSPCQMRFPFSVKFAAREVDSSGRYR